jgi:hypothetical protein
MKNQTVRLNNDEIFLAFEDWLHGYLHAVFTEEIRAACVSAVREFAEFIAPTQLSDSTVTEIKAFEKNAKINRRLKTSELKATLMGMGYFRSFRKELLKPTPQGKISSPDARRLLAKVELHQQLRGPVNQ